MPPTRTHCVIAAISLANLLCLRIWASVLDPATSYFLGTPRPPVGYAGTLVLFALIAAAGSLAALRASASRGRERRAWQVAFIGAVALGAYCAREQIGDVAGVPVRTYEKEEGLIGHAMAVVGVAILLVAFLPDRVRGRFARGAFTALLVLSPFALVTTFQTGWAMVASRALTAFPAPAPAPVTSTRAPARTVLLVLDELDQFIAFEDRVPGVSVPNLDALVAESLHFTRGVPPGRTTETIIPSLLTGRIVTMTSDAGAGDRRLRFSDGSTELFSETRTIFTRAREAGWSVGLAGWFQPYCRVLGNDLARCYARSIRAEFEDKDLWQVVAWQARVLLENLPQERRMRRYLGIRRVRSTPVAWHEESWRRIHREGISLAADPELDLVYLHYPLPHMPYLRVVGDEHRVVRGTYGGNLELMDRCLGELHDAIASAGLAEKTVFIAMSDHPLRGPGLRPLPSPRLAAGERRPVPMIIRFPQDRTGVKVETPVETQLLEDVLPEILEGHASTADALQAALERAGASVSALSR